MKLRIKRDLLFEEINNVSKAISTKNIIPILSGIKFEITKDKLILTASDNDITIQTILDKSEDFEIFNTGSIVIKGKYILDIIRKLDAEYINMEIVDDHKVLIYTDNSEFNLNGIDCSEYPNIDLSLTGEAVYFSVKDFREIISQTNYACSLDEARLVLTGVNIKINEDFLECSATDSYRLALRKLKVDSKLKDNVDIIIPSHNLNEMMKILPLDDTEKISMYVYSNKVNFKFGNLVFQSRLINGSYPNTKNLLPNEELFELKINKKDLFNMVDRASILNNDRDNNVITLELNNKMLKITSMSLEIGKVEEKLTVDSEEKIKISFSSKYMMDALRTISSEEALIIFVGEVKPILIKDVDDDLLTCLILPIRTY